MSARDALASSLEFISKEQRVAEADYILRRLAAKGYSIIPPGGMHEPTLEKAAKVAADLARDWLVGQPMETRRDAPPGIAAAIRALSHEGERKG